MLGRRHSFSAPSTARGLQRPAGSITGKRSQAFVLLTLQKMFLLIQEAFESIGIFQSCESLWKVLNHFNFRAVGILMQISSSCILYDHMDGSTSITKNYKLYSPCLFSESRNDSKGQLWLKYCQYNLLGRQWPLVSQQLLWIGLSPQQLSSDAPFQPTSNVFLNQFCSGFIY